MKLPVGAGAVVTGAGSGLGRALALDLARRGARVMCSDIREETAKETAELVRKAGAEAFVNVCDVASWEQVQALAESAESSLGQVDLVCNNAGVAVGGPFEDVSLEDWEWIVGINLWGVIYGCRAFLPGMRERRRGWVINTASAAGLIRSPMMSPYNVTKIGVVGLSETLYAEYKEHGVNVSVLCPTFFKTNIVEDARGGHQTPEEEERIKTFVRRQMEKSKVQAPDVARAAVDGVLKGDLYVVPMRDGRVMWRLKRLMPERFCDLLMRGQKMMEKKAS